MIDAAERVRRDNTTKHQFDDLRAALSNLRSSGNADARAASDALTVDLSAYLLETTARARRAHPAHARHTMNGGASTNDVPAGGSLGAECGNAAPARATLLSVAGVLDGLLSSMDEGEFEEDPIAYALLAGARVGLGVAVGDPL